MTKPKDKRNDFLFHIPYFLSFVATPPQHLRMEILYHNSYFLPELSVTTPNFCIALDLLQLGFFNRLKSLIQKFHGRNHELFNRYGVFFCTMKTDLFNVRNIGNLPLRCTQSMLPLFSGVQFAYLYLLHCMYYFIISYVLCCVCLFYISGLCPWITVF